jgi:hypothetical protein
MIQRTDEDKASTAEEVAKQDAADAEALKVYQIYYCSVPNYYFSS